VVLRNTSQLLLLLLLRRTRTGTMTMNQEAAAGCAHDEPEILLSSNADQLPAHGFLNIHRESAMGCNSRSGEFRGLLSLARIGLSTNYPTPSADASIDTDRGRGFRWHGLGRLFGMDCICCH
jgi:hypothetical protein